jgi:hypothetical protein
MKTPEVITTESGLAVVVDDPESLRTELRKDRRSKNRARRQKRAQGRVASQKGQAMWRARAKAMHKNPAK